MKLLGIMTRKTGTPVWKVYLTVGLLMGGMTLHYNLKAQGIDMEQNLLMFHVNGGAGIPGADLAQRFGFYGKTGAALSYRFGNNWYASVSGDFIFGSKVKEDDALDHIMTKSGQLIGVDGALYIPELQMRGWQWMGWGGKLYPLNKKNTASGLVTMVGAGYVQHRINYYLNDDQNLPQITGENEKGYDRLSTGFAIAEYVGYHHMSKNRLINFNIGLEMIQAFTTNQREFDYALAKNLEKNRKDLMFNLKVSWILPFYRRDKIEIPDESNF